MTPPAFYFGGEFCLTSNFIQKQTMLTFLAPKFAGCHENTTRMCQKPTGWRRGNRGRWLCRSAATGVSELASNLKFETMEMIGNVMRNNVPRLATHATYGAIHHLAITLNRTAQQAAAAARAGERGCCGGRRGRGGATLSEFFIRDAIVKRRKQQSGARRD